MSTDDVAPLVRDIDALTVAWRERRAAVEEQRARAARFAYGGPEEDYRREMQAFEQVARDEHAELLVVRALLDALTELGVLR